MVKVIDWIAEIASEAPSLRDLHRCLCAEQSAIAREAGPRDFSLLIIVKREARIERIAGHLHQKQGVQAHYAKYTAKDWRQCASGCANLID